MSRSLSPLQAILLGLVVLCGLGLATAGLFAVGNRQWLWSDTLHVTVGFAQIRGVEAGTRVRVQGIEAGEVEAVIPPTSPGGEVALRLRLDGRMRSLIREDATVQIVNEGMIGGKALEIQPGTASARPVQENAALSSKPTAELADVLRQVNTALTGIQTGQGTVGKLVTDKEAYGKLLELLQQSQQTMASFQQDADAIKRLPVIRSYVEDTEALLIRPNCECNLQYFAAIDLFEPDSAILSADGRQRLDELGPWLGGLKQKGSEIVVAAYADPKSVNPAVARVRTKQQSEAVSDYLKSRHKAQKLGWFSSRKVIPLGLGTSLPPLPQKDPLPPDRVEVLVFVPQS
jgi:phospholipid/cholesterol/gamma-HCH transport system substrate-binding protein